MSPPPPRKLWQLLLPERLRIDALERLRACAGALLGILLTGLISRYFLDSHALPWLIAPMGASAVLLFAVPSSPLAQPWSVIGGNLAASIVGVACWQMFEDPVVSSCMAVGLAIGAMFALRCLHPPSGAVALTAVLGGPAIHDLGFAFVATPVLANSVCIVMVALAYNRITGRSYPHRVPALTPATSTSDAPSVERVGFTAADLDVVLKEYNEVLDVSRDDLQSLFLRAEAQAYRRRLGEILCGDIMSHDIVTAEFATPLDEAWNLMRMRRVSALPVIDRARRVVGIVTLADFMKSAKLSSYDSLADRFREFVQRTRSDYSSKPEVAGQIMSAPAQTATVDSHIANLVPLLSSGGHSHVPIIDAERRLVGIITPRDLIAALYRGKLSERSAGAQ